MSKVQTSMQRSIPIIKDLGAQFEMHPECDSVFLYDDGGVFRAFAVTKVDVSDTVVAARRHSTTVVSVPVDTVWRCLDRSVVDIHTGEEVEVSRMTSLYKEHTLKEEMVTKLGLNEPKKKATKKKSAGDTTKDKTHPGMYL